MFLKEDARFHLRSAQYKEPENKYLGVGVDWNLSMTSRVESPHQVPQGFLISRGMEEK